MISFENLFSPLAIVVVLIAGSIYYQIHSNAKASSTLRSKPDDRKESQSMRFARSDVAVTKESEFPDSWWNGKDNFDLEKRALFSKTWLFITHRSRFTKPGDYHSFELSGFPFFLILGKDNVVRAFHNVCRHRAYTVTKKESGSSLVLGCRYHGWSYNTAGGLVKAPHFDEVPGFDKSQNGLFDIHTRTTDTGLIYVNLDASPSVPDVDLSATDIFMGRKSLATEWIDGVTLEGKFNWKLTASMQIVDTDAVEQLLPQSFVTGIRQTFFGNSSGQRSSVHSIFPISRITAIAGSGIWYSICVLPMSESHCRIRCDVYSATRARSTAESFSSKLFVTLKEGVRNVEKKYESILNSTSPLSYIGEDTTDQELHREILIHLKTHSKLEKTLGKEVIPTLRPSRTSQKYSQADIICKELDCLSKQSMSAGRTAEPQKQQVLAW